jgi:hypothetical protein
MANTTRALVVAGLMVGGLTGTGRPAVAGGVDGAALTRVRSSNPAIVRLIGEASTHSRTFRTMVETINGSQGFVYVEEGRCGQGVRACLVNVTTAGSSRVVWVKVDTRKADQDLMGSIGHELRHTIEVLEDGAVKDVASLYMFYARLGTHDNTGAFETAAAEEAGHAVRAEARRHRAERAPAIK